MGLDDVPHEFRVPDEFRVPEEFRDGAHRTADLRDLGLDRGRLRGKDFRSPFRGVHVWTGQDRSVRQRILEAAAILPSGAAIGGWAAAFRQGQHWIDGLDDEGRELPVLFCLPRSGRVRARAGIRVIRSDLDETDVHEIDGIPFTTPRRTGFDLVRTSGDVRVATRYLDGLWVQGFASPETILEDLTAHPRAWGSVITRHACDLAVFGVRSPKETDFRLVWEIDAKLPRPLVNPRITDLEGRHLGRPDVLDLEAGSAGEFDGRGHLDLETATVDRVRHEGLERHGVVVGRFTSVDLRPVHRRRTVWRMRDLRARGLARRGEPRRWIVAPD